MSDLTTVESTVKSDATKVESTVESDIKDVQTDVSKLETESYTFKAVAIIAAVALGIGIIVGLVL